MKNFCKRLELSIEALMEEIKPIFTESLNPWMNQKQSQDSDARVKVNNFSIKSSSTNVVFSRHIDGRKQTFS